MKSLAATLLIAFVAVIFISVESYAGTTPSQRAVLDDIARGGDGSAWQQLSAQQLSDLAAKADTYLNNYKTYHIPDGLNADLVWSSTSCTKTCWATQGWETALRGRDCHITTVRPSWPTIPMPILSQPILCPSRPR